MNLRDAIREARKLGLSVRKNKAGEYHVRDADRGITINSGRKCAPRCLTVMLKRAKARRLRG